MRTTCESRPVTESFHFWHLTEDAPRRPRRVSAGERVTVEVGTWPFTPGQSVRVMWHADRGGSRPEEGRADAVWMKQVGSNGYWEADLGAFQEGDRVTYTVHAAASGGSMVAGPRGEFTVGPKVHLALLWHFHQPSYRHATVDGPGGRYVCPWVRLHALRDYYAMGAIVREHSGIHVTFNWTPVLLAQLEDYTAGATDRALELTLRRADLLTASERGEVLATFFDADWHHQILCHPRYRELFEQRARGEPFDGQDIRDLQMWFNLAWFGPEFREGEVELTTGEHASVQRFVDKARGFSERDVHEMVEEQRRILRAVVPLFRLLQDSGQVEISTTPYAHPILPLLIDTGDGSIDRPGATRPPPFSWPEDAAEQIAKAVDIYRRCFGRKLTGMWPAEGAVSRRAIPFFARADIEWIASDQGVLRRSGEWGYEVDNPDVLCQARHAMEGGSSVAVFFRDTELSDAIGFRYGSYADPDVATADFLDQIQKRFADRLRTGDPRVLTVVLDGENAWGAYDGDGRPFLHSLYRRLELAESKVRTVTFREWIEGNPRRNVHANPVHCLEQVHNLFTGSWIDENASLPGVDLGTWIGEPEENRAWALLDRARRFLAERGLNPSAAPQAFEAMYAAEGSDWFWWLGDDQESGNDAVFDDLFRGHLRRMYRELGASPPQELLRPIVPGRIVWTFADPVHIAEHHCELVVRTNCPGAIIWRVNEDETSETRLAPVGGVMAGPRHHEATFGPFPESAKRLRFSFRCEHPGCPGGTCCMLIGEREVRFS